uniref:Calicivirus coat protein domain-containing protein n=1 Tax=Picornavirales sp. TaxID=1955153 RepID=A0A6M3YRN7_9VIRU|nr:MAG: hypothetical protein 2 [Picornavirales sp.]
MSQAQIPQPNAAPEAPSEQFGSTEAAPTGITVSGIGVPGVTPQEAQTHALAQNGVDPILYQQFIHNSNFTWSTSDQPGKLLWSMPITPKKFNKITARLATIYNIWTGGVDLNFKLAGTGFHAGALVMVRLPPNYTAEELAGTFDFTAFEYIVIDPKQLEVASLHVGDQRPVNYHYTNPEKEQPGSWDIGGTIAVYVQMALNTASTGTQQIQVNVWTRLARDFAFVQLRMPREITDNETDFVPSALLEALNFNLYNNIGGDGTLDFSLSTFRPSSTLRILPSSVIKLLSGTEGTHALDGSKNGIYALKPNNSYGPTNTKILQAATLGDYTIDSIRVQFSGLIQSKSIRLLNYSKSEMQSNEIASYKVNDGNYLITLKTGQPGNWDAGDNTVFYPTNYYEISTGNDYNQPALPVKESWVLFSGDGGNAGWGHVQTMRLATLFRTGSIHTWLQKGQCGVFNVIDTEVDLPIFQVKLWANGWFSTVLSANTQLFQLFKLRFEFVGFMQETDLLRPTPQFTMNNLLVAPIHRRGLRHSERLEPTEQT